MRVRFPSPAPYAKNVATQANRVPSSQLASVRRYPRSALVPLPRAITILAGAPTRPHGRSGSRWSSFAPEWHRDLLEAQVARLATIGPDGRPQLSAVWFPRRERRCPRLTEHAPPEDQEPAGQPGDQLVHPRYRQPVSLPRDPRGTRRSSGTTPTPSPPRSAPNTAQTSARWTGQDRVGSSSPSGRRGSMPWT